MTTHEPGPPEEAPPGDEEISEAEFADESPDTGVDPPGDGDLERLAAERDEYLSHLQRMQAEFDNFRKRTLRDQTAYLERANAGLIEQLLPVLDSFELALGSAGPSLSDSGAERLRKGVELVYGGLVGVLEKAGLERIEAEGKPFDPEEHEAVMQVESDDGEPGVRDVVRAGYRLKGRVIRPAMVKVAG